jgi:hypothetical protein
MRVLLSFITTQDETDIRCFHGSSYLFKIGVRFIPEILAIIYFNSDLEIGRSDEKFCLLTTSQYKEEYYIKAGYKSFLSHHYHHPRLFSCIRWYVKYAADKALLNVRIFKPVHENVSSRFVIRPKPHLFWCFLWKCGSHVGRDKTKQNTYQNLLHELLSFTQYVPTLLKGNKEYVMVLHKAWRKLAQSVITKDIRFKWFSKFKTKTMIYYAIAIFC